MFKNFRFQLIMRVLLLAASIGGCLYLWLATAFYLSTALLGLLAGYQTYRLIHYVELTNRKLTRFLNSIRYSDFSRSFSSKNQGASFEQLDEALSKVIKAFKEQRIEKQIQFRYMQTVVQHIGIGLISFNHDGEVELINTAAKRLFDIPTLRKIQALDEISPALVQTIKKLGSGKKDVVSVPVNNRRLQLSVYATTFRLRDEMYKLISLQDINAELEDKEMEAWQNLTQVLAHEIMNSVTPIASLSDTVQMLLTTKVQKQDGGYKIDQEAVEDVSEALETIENRSEGLIQFVNSYRDFTQVPEPNKELFSVQQLLDRVYSLHKGEAKRHNITITASTDPETLELTADPHLIEQVLINLIKNAFRALKDQSLGRIDLRGELSNRGRATIPVHDSGPGIPSEHIEKVFIPFFSTRRPYEGSGSGIGLSLSRQIMR